MCRESTQPLTYTGRNPLHSIDVMSTLAFDVLGMTHNYVPGFFDSAEITTSIEQGETNITGVGSATWNTQMKPRLVDTGKVKALFQYGVYSSPTDHCSPTPRTRESRSSMTSMSRQRADAPSGELYEAYKFAERAQGTANFLLLGPPGMNEEATEILRAAVEKAMADPETIAEAEQALKAALRHVGIRAGASA